MVQRKIQNTKFSASTQDGKLQNSPTKQAYTTLSSQQNQNWGNQKPLASQNKLYLLT